MYKKLLFSLNVLLNFNIIFSTPTQHQLFLIDHVQNSIENAELGISNLNEDILAIHGMSSNKVRHFLNNLCSLADAHYLEIGVWQGSTFVSALYGNNLSSAIAIDNWSEFSGPKNIFLNNLAHFLSSSSYRFYEADSFNFDLANISNKINIYFYDGGHSKEQQKKAFTYYNSIFEDTFIAIVDDYNCDKVQLGTQEAFQELGYTILFEKVLPAAYNGDTENWWNGLYVAVIAKN